MTRLVAEEKAIASSCQSGPSDTAQPTTGLGTRVVHGAIWVFATRITNRLFQLARTIVLAKLLAPTDFGLFGIALLAMSGLETFSQTGIKKALVQKKGDPRCHLDTAWTVQVIRGFALGLIAFAMAPFVATFFDAPAAKSIIQVVALSELLKGFTNIGVVYFQKELEFQKRFVYEFCSTLSDLSVAITAAFLLKSVWALMFGLLARNGVGTLLSYLIHPYRPRLEFNRQQFNELFHFGRWILGSTILLFIVTQGDDIFVGRLFGVSSLGFYQLAYRLSNVPTTEIAHVISQVTFPAYSKIQDDVPRLKEAYLRTLRITALFSFPIAGLIFVLAQDFTQVFLGQKWMPMVPLVQILVMAGLVRSIVATTGPIFLSVGQPRIETVWQFIRLLVLCVLIYPLSLQWNIQGVSLAVLLSISVSAIGFVCMVSRTTRCQWQEIVKAVAFPAIASVLVVLSILALKTGHSTVELRRFFALAGMGCFTYLMLIYSADRLFNYGTQHIIRGLIRDGRVIHKNKSQA